MTEGNPPTDPTHDLPTFRIVASDRREFLFSFDGTFIEIQQTRVAAPEPSCIDERRPIDRLADAVLFAGSGAGTLAAIAGIVGRDAQTIVIGSFFAILGFAAGWA